MADIVPFPAPPETPLSEEDLLEDAKQLLERAKQMFREATEKREQADVIVAGVAGVYELNIKPEARVAELESELAKYGVVNG